MATSHSGPATAQGHGVCMCMLCTCDMCLHLVPQELPLQSHPCRLRSHAPARWAVFEMYAKCLGEL